MSMLSHHSNTYGKNRYHGSGSLGDSMMTQAQFNKKLREVILEKQDQEQQLIQAKVEWATCELECDRLRFEIQRYREREHKLESEKYEETLKLSILEK